MNGLAGYLFVIDFALRCNLSGQDNIASLTEDLTGDVTAGVLFQVSVENGIGDQIANFVRMSFRNGLRRKSKAGRVAHVGDSPQSVWGSDRKSIKFKRIENH